MKCSGKQLKSLNIFDESELHLSRVTLLECGMKCHKSCFSQACETVVCVDLLTDAKIKDRSPQSSHENLIVLPEVSPHHSGLVGNIASDDCAVKCTFHELDVVPDNLDCNIPVTIYDEPKSDHVEKCTSSANELNVINLNDSKTDIVSPVAEQNTNDVILACHTGSCNEIHVLESGQTVDKEIVLNSSFLEHCVEEAILSVLTNDEIDAYLSRSVKIVVTKQFFGHQRAYLSSYYHNCEVRLKLADRILGKQGRKWATVKSNEPQRLK